MKGSSVIRGVLAVAALWGCGENTWAPVDEEGAEDGGGGNDDDDDGAAVESCDGVDSDGNGVADLDVRNLYVVVAPEGGVVLI